MKKIPLAAACLLLAACTQNRPEEGGFYSWVDAQGNMVTVPRDQAPAAEAATQAGQEDGAPASGSAAMSEAELDGEVEYQTDEDVQALIEQRQRDRFVIYRDSSGYQVVQPVDVPAEREAREQKKKDLTEPLRAGGQVFIERIEGVPANCCQVLLEDATELKVGEEQLVNFVAQPHQWVAMPGRHPGRAVRLDPAVKLVRIQSFLLKTGYIHPQAVFLNEQGVPVLLVDNLFVRRHPESWYRYASLEGEVEVPEGATSLVLYLSYAVPDAAGRPELVPGRYLWAEPDQSLSVNGELLLRGLSGE
jgi:hypothetical protein